MPCEDKEWSRLTAIEKENYYKYPNSYEKIPTKYYGGVLGRRIENEQWKSLVFVSDENEKITGLKYYLLNKTLETNTVLRIKVSCISNHCRTGGEKN